MQLKTKAQIMDEKAMNRALTRIAHEIIEKTKAYPMLSWWVYKGEEFPWLSA